MAKLFVIKLFLLPLLLGWQVQGGTRQQIQVPNTVKTIQPATLQVQGNDPDNEIQPAMGSNVLDSSGQPIDLIFTAEY